VVSTSPGSTSVIIVNFNCGDFIQTAINHLKSQSRPPDQVIVVDNASTDGSVDRLDLSGLNDARLIRLDDNLGFAAANNIAAREATGEWLALLNPDTRPQADWLKELIRATERYPGVSMFASTQLDAEQPQILDGAGDCYFIVGIPWRGGFGRPASELPGGGECFSPCGAAGRPRQRWLPSPGHLAHEPFFVTTVATAETFGDKSP